MKVAKCIMFLLAVFVLRCTGGETTLHDNLVFKTHKCQNNDTLFAWFEPGDCAVLETDDGQELKFASYEQNVTYFEPQAKRLDILGNTRRWLSPSRGTLQVARNFPFIKRIKMSDVGNCDLPDWWSSEQVLEGKTLIAKKLHIPSSATTIQRDTESNLLEWALFVSEVGEFVFCLQSFCVDANTTYKERTHREKRSISSTFDEVPIKTLTFSHNKKKNALYVSAYKEQEEEFPEEFTFRVNVSSSEFSETLQFPSISTLQEQAKANTLVVK